MIFFTSEQHMIKKMVADFSEKEVAAAVPNMEKGEFPRGLLKQMADLGLMGNEEKCKLKMDLKPPGEERSPQSQRSRIVEMPMPAPMHCVANP